MTIGVDTRSNSLIVLAPEPLFAEVKEFVAQVALVKKYDTNGDGVLTKDEWAHMSNDPSSADLNRDGRITLDDATSMAANAHDFKIKIRQLGVTAEQAAQSGIY